MEKSQREKKNPPYFLTMYVTLTPDYCEIFNRCCLKHRSVVVYCSISAEEYSC